MKVTINSRLNLGSYSEFVTDGTRAIASVVVAACTAAAALLAPAAIHAEDAIAVLKAGDRSLTNACVVSANSAALVFRHAGGYEAIPRKDLSDEMQARFAEELHQRESVRKEEIERLRTTAEETAADVRIWCQRQEAVQSQRIMALQRQLNDLQNVLDVMNRSARGKPNSPARRQADQMRARKMELISALIAAQNARSDVLARMSRLP